MAGIFSSCQLGSDNNEIILAEFEDNELLWSDLEDYVPPFLTPQDSSNKVKALIDDWVKGQLIISSAKNDSSINLSSIDKKVERLKQDLIIHAYNSNLIKSHLDTSISNDLLMNYYNDKKNSFILKEKFIKGYFITVSNSSPLLSKFKNLFYKSDTVSIKQLQDLSQAQATNYYFSLKNWEKLNSLLVQTPFFKDKKNVDALIKNKQLIKRINDDTFFFKITELISEGETSPFEIKKETIRNILLNERKQKVVKEHSEKLYQQATQNRAYKIH